MNAKQKGSSFERSIAKSLTKWLTGKEKPLVYWRSPSSGVLQTISREMESTSGDIISLSPDGDFLTDRISIEVKTGYRSTDFYKHFKDLKNNEIHEFWKQAVGDARKAGKWAALIYRKKSLPIIIGLEKDISDCLDIQLKSLTLHFTDGLPDVTFFDFGSFLSVIKPDDIKEKIKLFEETGK